MDLREGDEDEKGKLTRRGAP